MYYDINETLSHNCLLNFVLGNRGTGKTYGFKEWAIKDFIKKGNQFVYLRRYKPELSKLDKFWDDIKDKFPDHKLEVKNKRFIIDGKEAGLAMPLTTAIVNKSVPFPKVNKLLFDEFIIDKGVYRYLTDEVTAFLEMYFTISRDRDIKVFFMANSISLVNPYTLFFDLKMPFNSLFYKKGDKLLQLVQNKAFIEHMKNTRIGKLLEGTAYSDYAIENKFLRDDSTFIEKKGGGAKYYFSFKYNNSVFGVWLDWSVGKMWVSEDIDPSCKVTYTLTLQDHSPNTLLVKRLNQSVLFKNFITAYKQGCVYFENIKVKNIVYDVIKMIIV